MPKLYKLTDDAGCTFGGMQWGEGVRHEAGGDISQSLCSNAWIHAYTSPEIAVIMNSVHASFKNPQLWECEGIVIKDDYGLKCGCRSITTIRRIPLPEISVEQTIRFAIGVASLVCSNESWRRWAVDWLTGKDRTAEAAEARARATA